MYDSGVGGLTVLKEIYRELPEERIIYYGDTARVPYGGRPASEIKRFAREIISFLRAQGVKMVVVACNTSSALALDEARMLFKMPILGMIEPGVRAAVKESRRGRIGIIATEGTVRSGAYEAAIRRLMPGAQVVSQACPLLVPLVEAGKTDSPETVAALEGYLEGPRSFGVDTLILGCTHYPYLTRTIRAILGPGVSIVDPARHVALEVKEVLARENMMNPHKNGDDRFIVSGDPGEFARLGSMLLGRHIANVEQISVEDRTAVGS
ncbi:MAG TPA: glutamate racemase [Firmicutes bacterium]|nr:glutamate racemase [Bacillota bacterium]